MFSNLRTIKEVLSEDLSMAMGSLVNSLDLEALGNRLDAYHASNVDGSITVSNDVDVLIANEFCRRMRDREIALLDELMGYVPDEEGSTHTDELKALYDDEGILG